MTDEPRCEWERRGRWYPQDRHGARHPARGRMFRLFAVAALVLVFLAITGIVSLAWMVRSRLGVHGWPALGAVLGPVVSPRSSRRRTASGARKNVPPVCRCSPGTRIPRDHRHRVAGVD